MPVGSDQVYVTVVIDNPNPVPVGIALPKLEVEVAPEREEYEFEGLFDFVAPVGGISTSCDTSPVWRGEPMELAPGELVRRSAVTDPRAVVSWTWTEYAADSTSTRTVCSRLVVAVRQGQCWLSAGLEASFCEP